MKDNYSIYEKIDYYKMLYNKSTNENKKAFYDKRIKQLKQDPCFDLGKYYADGIRESAKIKDRQYQKKYNNSKKSVKYHDYNLDPDDFKKKNGYYPDSGMYDYYAYNKELKNQIK